jgi:hypothetical protein
MESNVTLFAIKLLETNEFHRSILDDHFILIIRIEPPYLQVTLELTLISTIIIHLYLFLMNKGREFIHIGRVTYHSHLIPHACVCENQLLFDMVG